MTIQGKLLSVKDKKSYSSPAKRTKEKLKPILSESDQLANRWMWELLQNASDLGSSISAQFHVSDDEMRFCHNGKGFDLEEAFNLIMPDSNKDGENPVIKDQIGQFGTGFISTHVLSSKITVRGIVEDIEDNSKYDFQFCLNREHRTDKDKLIDSIKESEKQYGESLTLTHTVNEFSTQFIYDLTAGYEGLNPAKIVDDGLKTLDELLPYVLTFRSQLSTVEVYDNRNNSKSYKKFSHKILPIAIDELEIHNVSCHNTNNELLSEDNIAVIRVGNAVIACPVEPRGERKFDFKKFPEVCPKLYCAFPMVGSSREFFPVVINSNQFVPNTERNGIALSQFDKENRSLLVNGVEAFKKLLKIAEDHRWDNGFFLLDFVKQEFDNKNTSYWYNNYVFNILRNKLKTACLIREKRVQDTRYLSMSNMWIPYYDKRSKDNREQLIKIHEFASHLINYALPDSNLLHDWYEAIDFDLYSALKLDYSVIAELINKDSDNLSNLAGGEEINEKKVNWLVSFIEYLVDKEELELFNKYKMIPNQNDQLCLLKNLYSDAISHKLLDASLISHLKKLSTDIGTDGDIRRRLIHEKIQSRLLGKFEFSELDLYDLCREVDDGIKLYKGNPRDQSFRAILKDMFAWKSESAFSDELMRDYFPYFGKEHSQLYLNTKSAEELTYAFEIDMSGKSEALARIAKTSLTTAQLNTIAENSTKLLSFIEWISTKEQDNPNEELGEMGEQYLNKELINIFGENRVFWDKAREYDFRILEDDLSTVKYYIDAKTTMKALGNTDNVPFYMRTAQWKFLENRNAYGKYVIARLEKSNEDYRVKYLKIGIENVN